MSQQTPSWHRMPSHNPDEFQTEVFIKIGEPSNRISSEQNLSKETK